MTTQPKPLECMPDIVEVMAKFDAAGGAEDAIAWLADNDIDPPPIPTKLIHVTGRHVWDVPGCELPHGTPVFLITPGEPNALAFPIMKNDDAIDLMLIDLDDMRYFTVLQEADWLGYDDLDADVVRLHFSPLDWLEAGCTGVCQIHPYARRHFKDLSRCKVIQCNSFELALEAWDWAFDGNDDELDRFECDDHPENIKAYFDRRVASVAQHKLAFI